MRGNDWFTLTVPKFENAKPSSTNVPPTYDILSIKSGGLKQNFSSPIDTIATLGKAMQEVKQVITTRSSTRNRPCRIEKVRPVSKGLKPRKNKRATIQSAPTAVYRRSLRIEKSRTLNDQLEKYTLSRTPVPAPYRDQKGAQLQKNVSALHRQVQETKQNNHQARPLDSPAVKRNKRRYIDTDDRLDCVAKRQRRHSSRFSTEQAELIEHWLDKSSLPSVADDNQLSEATDNIMPQHRGPVLPSPRSSFQSSTSTSRRSERSSVSVHDPDYRQSLHRYNIQVNCDDPPLDLMQRAKKIISRPRLSPDLDDETAQRLARSSRRLDVEGEEVIVQRLASSIIPAMKTVPDQRIDSNADQLWANSVPIPLDPSMLTNSLPLPKPKPDLAFGYSREAFTKDQLGTIELLIDDQYGRSYAVPDSKLRFPFLDVEFKSQAKNGTHFVATNQVAGAGAIAMNGSIELMQRRYAMEDFDYCEPQFFSVTMDHELARINVHWTKADDGKHSFHAEGLSQHLLNNEDGVRAVRRAIKNIIDYGADSRLPTLCQALDAYRTAVLGDREAANPQKLRHDAQRHILPSETTRERHADREKTKRGRHRPSGAQNNQMRTFAAAPISTTRRTVARPEKSVCNNSTELRNHRHGAADESKRHIKPSQKLLDSREPRNRHG